MTNTKRITIVGGGFSGLLQAFYLAEAGLPVRVIEKESRWGGLLGSQQKEQFLFEQAANAFIANAELERVSRVIQVPLISKTSTAQRRFIFRDGEMRRWPLSWSESLALAPFLLQKKWRRPPKDGESLWDWGVRELGEGATRNLLEPAVQGIYAARLPVLSASLVLGSLNQKIRKGKLRGSVSPQGGMQAWVDGLVRYLLAQGAEMQLSTEFKGGKPGEPFILALGLQALRELVNTQRLSLPRSILETRCASLSSVSLGFNDPQQRLQEGFGCLFPKAEGFSALGVLFNHSIFPGRVQEGASETWILNDEKMEFSRMSPTALLRYVQSDRSLLTKNLQDPDQYNVSQWSQRIPLYDQNLRQFIEDYRREKAPTLLIGNFLGDLGLSKILFHAIDNRDRILGGYLG